MHKIIIISFVLVLSLSPIAEQANANPGPGYVTQVPWRPRAHTYRFHSAIVEKIGKGSYRKMANPNGIIYVAPGECLLSVWAQSHGKLVFLHDGQYTFAQQQHYPKKRPVVSYAHAPKPR